MQKPPDETESMEKQHKIAKMQFFLQTEICAKNLALANVNYSISDISMNATMQLLQTSKKMMIYVLKYPDA